jgi:hypothetical protein
MRMTMSMMMSMSMSMLYSNSKISTKMARKTTMIRRNYVCRKIILTISNSWNVMGLFYIQWKVIRSCMSLWIVVFLALCQLPLRKLLSYIWSTTTTWFWTASGIPRLLKQIRRTGPNFQILISCARLLLKWALSSKKIFWNIFLPRPKASLFAITLLKFRLLLILLGIRVLMQKMWNPETSSLGICVILMIWMFLKIRLRKAISPCTPF